MEVYLNRIDGWDDTICSMFFSKRHMDREFEQHIRKTVAACINKDFDEDLPIGAIVESESFNEMKPWLDSFFKFAWHHITMGRFLDFSFTVYGLHRAGQDDWDSHAKRMDNRIIRNSTRLADYKAGEVSDYYADKIIPTDVALAALGIVTPDEIEYEGEAYVKSINGYIKKGMENNRDVKRGLYMLSIPSSFIFKINLTEFAHIYKERNENGGAAPEVKQLTTSSTNQLMVASHGYINPEFLMKVLN